MGRARVMLAPSLVDGTPNSMFEAMATGAFPILSPLDTIRPLVRDGCNVLFARNLYPDEIGEALVRAMTDDVLVDIAAERNLALVRELADRHAIRPRVVGLYESLAAARRHESARPGRCGNARAPAVARARAANGRLRRGASVRTQDYASLGWFDERRVIGGVDVTVRRRSGPRDLDCAAGRRRERRRRREAAPRRGQRGQHDRRECAASASSRGPLRRRRARD